MTSAEIDLRVGGTWRHVVSARGGPETAFHGAYRAIVANERIVSTEVYEGAPEAESINTMTLTEHDGRTTMTVVGQHSSQVNRDAVIAAGTEIGMNAALDSLEQVAQALA